MEIKKVLTKKYRKEGAIVPRGYGIAYRDYYTNDCVCYLIPLHLFVIAWRRVRWCWGMGVKFAGFGGKWNRKLNAQDVLLRLADDIEKGSLSDGEPRHVVDVMRKIARRCLP